MEVGHKLLGALEVAGAALVAAALSLRALQRLLRRLGAARAAPRGSRLAGRLALVLGADRPLGRELALQLEAAGCRVARAGRRGVGLDRTCDATSAAQVRALASYVRTSYGPLDILVHTTGKVPHTSDPLDTLAATVSGHLMEHLHVVSQFVPELSMRDGHFVAVETQATSSRSFSSTEDAAKILADTLTKHMAYNGGSLRVMRVSRRAARRGDTEDLGESAAAVLHALENGRLRLTLPPASRHIRNTFRYMLSEAGHLWNEMVSRQWKLST